MNTQRDITDHLHGAATNDAMERLEAWVREDLSNAEDLVRAAMLDNLLAEELRIRECGLHHGVFRRQAIRLAAAVAFAALSIGVLAYGFLSSRPSSGFDGPRATLAAEFRASWGASDAIDPGDTLREGSYVLLEGLVQIDHSSGAVLVIEGPSTFRLDATGSSPVFLERGRITVLCPTEQSRSLVLGLPHGLVTDLGTEYGVLIGDEGDAFIKVIDGAVEVSSGNPSAGTDRVLNAGEVIGLGVDGFEDVADVHRRPVFVRVSDLDAMRELPALSPKPELQMFGVDAGSTGYSGRYDRGPGRRGPRTAGVFLNTGDFADVELPAASTKVSMAAWVRIADEPAEDGRRARGLFLTDGWGEPGQLHWQIKDGTIRAAFPLGVGEIQVRSVAGFDPGEEWTHVALTIDVEDAREMRQYVDGQLVDRVALGSAMPDLRLSPAVVGGWRGSDDRNLNGSIEDFAVYARTLSAAEIEEMYEAGSR